MYCVNRSGSQLEVIVPVLDSMEDAFESKRKFTAMGRTSGTYYRRSIPTSLAASFVQVNRVR